MGVILETVGLTKEYSMGEVAVKALRGINLQLFEGEFVCILGPSGSGKSTILNIIGGIDTPTKGHVFYAGRDISRFSAKQLTMYRRQTVGFVFQFYNLMQNLTAMENIELAASLSERPFDARQLLRQIGLEQLAGNFPSQMSGGQQQRIAIARAIVKNPTIMLCDEPTGALDFSTGLSVLRLLKDFNTQYRKTVIIITHNAGIGEMADRVLTVRDGLIAGITVNSHPLQPEEVRW